MHEMWYFKIRNWLKLLSNTRNRFGKMVWRCWKTNSLQIGIKQFRYNSSAFEAMPTNIRLFFLSLRTSYFNKKNIRCKFSKMHKHWGDGLRRYRGITPSSSCSELTNICRETTAQQENTTTCWFNCLVFHFYILKKTFILNSIVKLWKECKLW